MKILAMPALLLCTCLAQNGSVPQGRQGPDPPGSELHLPQSQREALIKADYKKNLEEATRLLSLAEELKGEIERDEAHIVSIKSMRKTQEIAKLANSIHGRLKRY
jgi:hypothetical protein